MGAVIQGCATIILVEPIAARRDIGQELGATHVIDPAEAGDLAAALRAIVPAGLDFAFDTSGVVPVIAAGLAALGSHGAVGLVHVPSEDAAALKHMIPDPMDTMEGRPIDKDRGSDILKISK